MRQSLSRNTLPTRSSACCEPVVISTCSGSTFQGRKSATARRSGSKPSLVAYCKAAAPSRSITVWQAWVNSARGKAKGEGRPPAMLMMPGRSVSLRISRMAEGFILAARPARVHWVINALNLKKARIQDWPGCGAMPSWGMCRVQRQSTDVGCDESVCCGNLSILSLPPLPCVPLG